jgi:hypothetical protein
MEGAEVYPQAAYRREKEKHGSAKTDRIKV